MKFKIEVEVDYLSEEGTIDQQMTNTIAAEVVKRISDDSMEQMTSLANKMINERANNLVETVFTELMAQQISITNQWGEPQKTYTNVKEMIQERFDKFLLEKVDGNGNTSSYGDNRRVDHIIKKQIDKAATEFTKNAVKEVTEKIKAVLSDDLKLALGDRLINMMEIDKIMHSQSKKLNA